MKRSASLALILGSLVTPLISSAAEAAPVGAPAVVRASGGLNVRAGAATDRAVTATLTDGGDRIAPGCYVADAYVRWTPQKPRYPWCGQEPATVPAASRQAYFARVAPAAQASMRKDTVSASVTIAQAVLESGWGRSTLTRVDHSYFGMKCFGSPGAVAIGCSSYATHECSGSRCYSTRADFRAYRSMADSFADHGRQLATLPRYQTAMKYAADPERFAREIHKAGYATSPTYADNLIKLIQQYGLTKYDKLP